MTDRMNIYISIGPIYMNQFYLEINSVGHMKPCSNKTKLKKNQANLLNILLYTRADLLKVCLSVIKWWWQG